MANLKLVSDQQTDDPILSKTTAYPIMDVKIVATDEFTTVPDIATGGKRKRKYGLVVSMSGIPNLDKQNEPLFFPNNLSTLMIDGDSLEEIRERAVYEIDIMIEQMREVINQMKSGKINVPNEKTPKDRS